jgi:periodic tryptophan protein 1
MEVGEEDDTSANYAISALCWVPRGAFALQPKRPEPPTEEEIKRMVEEGNVIKPVMRNDMEEDDDVANEQQDEELDDEKINEELKEYNFADYDNEAEIDLTNEYFKSLGGDNLRAFASNADDPYLKDYDTDSSEERDLEMREDDIQILSIQNEEDATTTLQVYVYEELENNLFLHHDILLQTYGLCVEWLSFVPNSPESRGNFAAVGTFDPFIEIWDIDVIDPLEPVLVLGDPEANTKKKKKKKKTAQGTNPHTGAVLGLAWHRQHQNILASSSDDNTVKLWDLNTAAVKMSLEHHKEPVQSVKWHLKEPNILLTGSFDKRCCVVDSTSKSLLDYNVASGIESLQWNPHSLNQFTVSTENGKVYCFDIRNNQKALIEFQAHNQSCSDVSFNSKIPNIIATSSHDGCVKIWNYTTQKLLWQKDMKSGELYCVSFNSDYLMAIGGMKDRMKVLDLRRYDEISDMFN